jgi:hypothetical protein
MIVSGITHDGDIWGSGWLSPNLHSYLLLLASVVGKSILVVDMGIDGVQRFIDLGAR